MKQFDFSKVKNILIIMMGGIGNMIFLTPALKALRKALPSSTFSFLLGPYSAEKAIEGSHLIDQKIIIEPGLASIRLASRDGPKRDFRNWPTGSSAIGVPQ